MPSPLSAKAALRHLKELKIGVPGSPDSVTGESDILFEFSVQAVLHTPDRQHFMGDHFCSLVRVNCDTLRALELAALLDEDRRVSVSTLSLSLDVVMDCY